VATLYVRNVPPELYEALRQWADEAGRSVNAEVLELIEHEAARRAERSDRWRRFDELRREIALTSEEADELIAAIRAGRDAHAQRRL
jgi:hypothetical protein